MADPIIKIKVEGSGLPAGGADGQVLTRKGGRTVWGDLPASLTEEDVLKLLITLGVAPVLTDADGDVLADGDGAILITAQGGTIWKSKESISCPWRTRWLKIPMC